MVNGNGVQYYASMYLGSQLEEITFILDTGSDYLWVPGDSCSTCTWTTVEYDDSDSTYYSQVSSKEQSVSYGSGTVEGTIATD
jgi:cathepsin D